jgi:nitrogen fixation NifU-like protein
MTDIYQQNIMDHFKNPENYGEMQNADVVQVEFNPLCGDKITVYLKFNGDVVEDISFEGSGCAISQASMSMLSEMVKGKSKVQVIAITKDDIVEMLGIDIGPTRLKCALLGWQGVVVGVKK